MNKTMFECDGFNGVFEGYTNGTYWNGWACPWFTKEVATQIVTANNSIEDAFRMEYDSTTDTFIVRDDDDGCELFEGRVFTIKGEPITLYPIGNGCWVWDDLADYETKSSRFVRDYLCTNYALHPINFYQVYHSIIQEIDEYMTKSAIINLIKEALK
jgi:hypothetical protein